MEVIKMNQNNKCPKCGGEMEEGIATNKNANGHFIIEWGTKTSGVLKNLENARQTLTYRCKSCGFLESYAK